MFAFTSLLVFTVSFALSLFGDETSEFQPGDADKLVLKMNWYDTDFGDAGFGGESMSEDLQLCLRWFADYDKDHEAREVLKRKLADERVALLETIGKRTPTLLNDGLDMFENCETHADKLAKMERMRVFLALPPSRMEDLATSDYSRNWESE